MKRTIYLIATLSAFMTNSKGQESLYLAIDIGVHSSSEIQKFNVTIPTGNKSLPKYSHIMKFPTHIGATKTFSLGYKKEKYAIELEYAHTSQAISNFTEYGTSRAGSSLPSVKPDSFTRYYRSTTRYESINVQGRYFLKQGKFAPYVSTGINFSKRDLHYYFKEELEYETNSVSIQLYDKVSLGFNVSIGSDLQITKRLIGYIQGGFTHTLYSPAEMDIQVFYHNKESNHSSIEPSKQRFQLDHDNSTKQVSTLLANARIGIRYNFNNPLKSMNRELHR